MSVTYQRALLYLVGVGAPLAVYAVFVGYPVAYNVYLGFTRWNGLSPTIEFVGFANYFRMLGDPRFISAFKNTLLWSALSLAIHLVVGMALAIILFSGRVYMPTLFRSLIFIPVTMSLVAVGLMFSLILSPNFGALDLFLRSVGLGGLVRTWLGDYHITIYVLIVVDAWAYLGIPMMLFHAGLSNIQEELFEAARLDGASEWQLVRHIMVPGLAPTIVVVTMLSVMHSMRTFDLVEVMTGGGPAGGSQVLGYYMYTSSFLRNEFGYGASIAVVLLLSSAGLALIYLKGVARDALRGNG